MSSPASSSSSSSSQYQTEHEGLLFIISAASGTGKTSLIEALLAHHPEIQLAVSHTTRPIRTGERDGVNYHFVSREDFIAMQNANAFLESAEVFGNFYGTSLAALQACLSAEQDVILEIDWQGAAQARRRLSDAVRIFILPPSIDHLRRRLKRRGMDSPESIGKRLAAAQNEIAHYQDFDYVVVNQEFDKALAQLLGIVQAERARLNQAKWRLTDLLSKLSP